MATHFASLLSSLAVFLTLSSAGIPVYYPPSSLPLPSHDDGNLTRSANIHRRYYSIDPAAQAAVNVPAPWNDGTIPFCFKNANSDTQLRGFVDAAWKVWVAAGLNSAIVHFGEYNNCPPADSDGNLPYGKDYLIIEALNGENDAAQSTVGNQRQNFIKMNPAPTFGTGDSKYNMAHEIGHTLGLYHEHQRPIFWGPNYKGSKGAVDQITFTCSALRDYPAHANDPQIQQACVDFDVATRIGFVGAAEYLPVTELGSADGGDIDWSSIMLYGSVVGGVTSGNPPTRENVYFRNNPRGVVPPNKTPSQYDIQRVKTIYNAAPPYPNPCLINQPCNKYDYLFFKLKCDR